jgi:4-amino-4-deoxy-L-arabinose transferase-like glycosyltransferase
MSTAQDQQQTSTHPNAHLYLLAALSLCFQLLPLLNLEYGYFRDELYYIACAKRLALGYVDHPPLAPFLLRLVLTTLGDSILAIRFFPALAGALTVFLTGLITRQLEGGKFAQSLAALAMAIAPGFLIFCGFFSMNPFESLLWTGCIYVIIRLLQQEKPRLWLLVGLLIGIGLLNKHTLVVYVLSLFVAFLLTPAWRYVLTKWFWSGVLLAALIVLPNVLWQIQHGFPSLEFYHNANLLKNIDNPPLEVFLAQVFIMNPLAFPVWLSGLCFYLFSRQGRAYRVFGLTYLFLLATMMWAGSSRPDRMLAAYPMLFAGGGLLIDQVVKRYSRWVLQSVIALLVLVGGLGFAPMALPILPPEMLLQFSQMLSPPQVEQGATAKLPQWFADRFGWEEMTSDVAGVYQSLPEQEQRQTLLLAENYGEAGALEFFGTQYDLPPVICPHNSYHSWSSAHDPVKTYVAIGLPESQLRNIFQEVEQAGLHTCTYCMDYENSLPIYICRKPRTSYADWWSEIRWYGGAKK